MCYASNCRSLLSILTQFFFSIFHFFFIFTHCLRQLTLPFSQRNLLPWKNVSNQIFFVLIFLFFYCPVFIDRGCSSDGDGFDSCPLKANMKTIVEKVFFPSDGGKRWVFYRKICSPELGLIKICSTFLKTHPLAAKTYQYSFKILCDFYCLVATPPSHNFFVLCYLLLWLSFSFYFYIYLCLHWS